ncbi:MAG: metallophosphoesterase family protein [Dorea sp.]|nr:metallophosphoesterase family protein [Dorea sp.]
MRYYIADLHFGHNALNEQMDCRGFESAEAMDEYMIKQWNRKVRQKDEVIILGDFCMSPYGETVNQILSRLNGRKYLIKGNHDRYLEDKEFNTKNFQWIEDYKEIKDNKRKIILSHYPMPFYNGQFRRGEDGSLKTYMLYGHVHDSEDETLLNRFVSQIRSSLRQQRRDGEVIPVPCQMINCFCMYSDYVPLTLDEWIRLDEERREKRWQEGR